MKYLQTFILCLSMGCLFFSGMPKPVSSDIQRIKITDLEKMIRESETPLIVSFWATFCQPCVEEIPYFEKEVKKYPAGKLRLILVSLDLEDYYPEKIKAFATRAGFASPIFWLDETNADYFCPRVDEQWSGAIPATLFVNIKKGYRKFYEEQVSPQTLEKEIRAIL